VSVIGASEVLAFMGTVTRGDVGAPYGRCIDCDCKTRSHVLEPAEYEIHIAEGRMGPAHNRNQSHSEVNDSEVFEMVVGPKVLCHKCWLIKQSKGEGYRCE
jgi:hypothetical protein